MMRFSLNMVQRLECSLCGGVLDLKHKQDNIADILLFGAVVYSYCPICYKTNMPKDDPKWRKKVDDWVKEQIEIEKTS